MNIINLLFLIIAIASVSARDQGDHGRNAVGFFIGFAIGLVIVGFGILCWYYFETFELCQRAQKRSYAAPPEKGSNKNYAE